MEIKKNILIVGLLVFQVALKLSSGHVQNGKLGDISFICPTGQYFKDGYCIRIVDVNMTWTEADRTCRRQGEYLVWVADEYEYDNVQELAVSTWDSYWIGLNVRDGGSSVAKWSNKENEAISLDNGLWENEQPDVSKGQCGFAKRLGFWSFGNCLRKLPFLCKSEAILQGYFRCRNGRGIQEKFKCDGQNDCEDNSDEVDCPNQCSYLINAQYALGAQKPQGEINSTSIYLDNRTCFWSIVTNIGSRIKVQIPSFQIEKNADVMSFTTGGMAGSIVLAELSGNVSPLPTYYSSDNVINMRMLTDSSVLKQGFRISWTTDVREISNTVQILTATSTEKDLKSVFYDSSYLPHEKVFEWVITAGTTNVITLKFVNIDIDVDGKFYLWEGDDVSVIPVLNGINSVPTSDIYGTSDIYISKSKTVRLMLITGANNFTFSKGIYIKYSEGCKINLVADEGIIQSPGYAAGLYPDNVNCVWTIQRNTTTRALSLIFTTFEIYSTFDYLKIYNDTSDSSAIHTRTEGFNGFDILPSVIRSTTGYIKVQFQTNYVLTARGFVAVFSLDCPDLILSSQTMTNTAAMYPTSFWSVTTLSCKSGYSFVQEEFNRQPTVNVTCKKGGNWNLTRIPNCMITYCSIPPAISNGFIVQSSGVKYGDNVTYQCNGGFTMIGTPNIKCRPDGTWENSPSCSASQCPDLTRPTNGNLTNLAGDGRSFSSVVRYACDPGYETYGNITTYCKTGGLWSHAAPTCIKILCGIPIVERGSMSPPSNIRYQMTVTLTCDSGFGINGSAAQSADLTCTSDKIFTPYVSCLDIDECQQTNRCPSTENCYNTIGSYMCSCKTGYQRLSSSDNCTDINECLPNGGKGPCDQKCVNTAPGYLCSCNMTGYILYTSDDFNNISVADGETGMTDGDVYQINHTCVRRQCPVPPPLVNGKVLSKKVLFFYEDVVEFTCDLGYIINGSERLKCGDGVWDHDYPSCREARCSAPAKSSIPRSTNIYPGESSFVKYGTMVNIECQYGSKMINRTLYCTYVGNNSYVLRGDAAQCPEINCGSPEQVPGSNYTGVTNTSLNSTFSFVCNIGFTRTGVSEVGTNTVTCMENGRWNLGNLTCTGGRCSDPGTPGGAVQVVQSYEVGQLLNFRCNNDGYYPSSSFPLECIVYNNSLIKWNTTDLPKCIDATRPTFTVCSSTPIYIDKTEPYTYPTPQATDNSNAVKVIKNDGGFYSGLRSNTDINITYVAEDFSGNRAECVIQVKIKDYTKPVLVCPSNKTEFIATASGRQVNVSDYVSVYNAGDFNKTFVPPVLTVDYTTIGKLQKVTVRFVDRWGAEDQCSFLVETKASACFRESFPTSIPNGVVYCTTGNITCNITCNAGYIFNDGNTTKKYECQNNQWTPVLPPDTCIQYDEPSYFISIRIIYQTDISSTGTRQFTANCLSGHNSVLNANNATLTQEIFSKCNIPGLLTVGNIVITNMVSTTSSFEFWTNFNIKLLDTTTAETVRSTCRDIINLQLTRDDFLDYSSAADCTTGTTTVIRNNQSTDNKILESGNKCEAGIQKMTVLGQKCVKCPQGTYSSLGDACTSCPNGQFQDLSGQTTCKTCPAEKPVPSDDKKTCLVICPAGFRSDTGLPPCMSCPEDRYWFNETTCMMCPNSSSTLGFNAITDISGCKAPCPTGQYSVTGYAPCKNCPVNYYQDQTTQTMCKPCNFNQITHGTGATSVQQCIGFDWTVSSSGTECCDACPGGDQLCCQANCSQQTSMRTCDRRCNDIYNASLPCFCNNACVNFSNCCPDYTWKCVNPAITCLTTNCSGHGTCVYKNNKRFCNCNAGYKGDNCEMELNPCDSSPCWNGGSCIKTGYDTYNCSCPVDTACKMIRQSGKIGQDPDWQNSGIPPVSLSTISDCEQYCLDRNLCIAVHYISGVCFIFYQLTLPMFNNTAGTLSRKYCANNALFGGDRCQIDLVNSCNSTCSEFGMCQDLLGNQAKCLCPTTGAYTLPKCERNTALCNPNPCLNGATCVSFGSVRYQCVCPGGYTGNNCETNIDECALNPGGCLYNGTCTDGVNKYTCNCASQFVGERCQKEPNFCQILNACPTGICYNNYDTSSFMCKCEYPYRLDSAGSCSSIPPCENVRCINGTCRNGVCECQSGFNGSLCQHNINDCANMPCQHNGMCTDKLNDYQCSCPMGYNGKNCENNIDDCVNMCTDPNAVGCNDRLNDYQCVCKPGYMGKNCTDNINECLQYPCQHSGTCDDLVNDFKCTCTAGWTGKRCDSPVEYCNPTPCLNDGSCYNLIDGYFCGCRGGTTGDRCANFPDVCSVIKPCINNGQCNNTGGTAVCNCNDNYDGTSCQLINNQCGDADRCKNSGTCSTKDIGFDCSCRKGFSGSTCMTYTDPCSSNPCHQSAKCKSVESIYMCYCDQGKTLTDEECKGIDPNFDIFIDNRIPGVQGFLRTPFVLMPGSNITIMFWARVVKMEEDVFDLIALEEVPFGTSMPTWNESKWIIRIMNNATYINMNRRQYYLPYTTDVANGEWHFIVFSWEQSGRIRIFIDAVTDIDQNTAATDQFPQILQVILGSGAHGRLSQLNIYRQSFADTDLFKAMEGYNLLPPEQLVQGWSNIALSPSVRRIFPSSLRDSFNGRNNNICDSGIPSGCPVEDRVKPMVDCPRDWVTVGKGRLTQLSGLKASGVFGAGVTNKSFSIHQDEVYSYGSSNEVFVGYDNASNYGICRFKVYVKYNDVCPVPRTNALIQNCSGNNSNICGFSCDSSKTLSMKSKNRYKCGKLGVYNYYHPREKFVLPPCGAMDVQTVALTVKMTYNLSVSCYSTYGSTIATKIAAAITGPIRNNWPGLCPSCTPTVIANCQLYSKFLDAEFTISGLQTNTTKESVTYKIREAILIVILQENEFNFPTVAGAVLNGDSVVITVSPYCSAGFVVVGDNCVQCGIGTFRNNTTMSCEYCPVGFYQDVTAQSSCKTCAAGNTTVTFGSYSSSDCIDNCPAGMYYNSSNTRCEDCQRHYYQDMSGQDYCTPCPVGTKTSGMGSNSSSSCYSDCAAGTELQADGSCKKCPRGYYRSQAEDNCISCPTEMTTTTDGTVTATDCSIRKCYAGNFRNATNQCEPCPVGQYQSKDLQDSCDNCETSYTTSGNGSTYKDNCTYYCDPGKEVVSYVLKTCRLCPRGTYRSNNRNEILMPCQNCSDGITTENTGSITAAQCTIRKCGAGQKVNSTGECEDCPIDTYQPNELPDSKTVCIPCGTGKGTVNSKSTKVDQCISICLAGQQNDGNLCTACPQGTWSNGDMTMRFGHCINCSNTNYTTVNTGSTHSDNCTLRKCGAGQKPNLAGECEDCPVDTYQPNQLPDLKTVCIPCGTGKGTMQMKSTTIDNCLSICLAGQQNDGNLCTACPQGTWSNGDMTMRFGHCINCSNTNYTTVNTGSTHADNCTLRDCNPGYYINGSDCLPCGYGQYQPKRQQDKCLLCSTEQNTSSLASTSQSACQVYCPAGKEGNITCAPCKADYFKTKDGLFACEQCTGNFTSNINRTSCSVLYCDVGFYNNGNNCTACPVGEFKDVRGNAASCTKCDPGMTTQNVASTSKTDCNVLYCIPGKFKNSTINVCQPCPVKTFKAEAGNQACLDCQSNKTTLGTGSDKASDCSIVYCDPGQYRSSGNICVDCAVGSYQPESGKDACMQCMTGYTTDGSGKKDPKDCYPICGKGFQFNHTSNECNGCKLGYYKDVVGNSINCTECPVNKTTSYENSTSVNNCNIDDCPPGYRRAAPTGCQICEKGYYQPMKSQESCITCGIKKTTETTGSTKLIQCINTCPDGQQYNFYNKTCTNCDKGFYTDRQKTEKCIKCPNGQTTLYPGATQCIINTISTVAPPASVTVPVKFVYFGRFDCSSLGDLENFRILVRGQIILRLKFLAVRYQGLCSNVNCQNINSLVITIPIGGCKPKANQGKRRRDVADNDLQFDVQIPEVSSTLTNADVTLTPSSLLQEDMAINLDQYTPPDLQNILSPFSATVSSPIIECPNGSVYSNDMCAICGKGFQFNHTSNECNGCKLGYYKDVVGNSINCTECPVNKTTSYENSTSVNNCNIDDCLPGYRRAAPTGCQICEKGYYQSMNSQESCITCGFKRTTETTGSTNAKQCINACPDGQQHNFYNDTCTNCDKGFYTDRQKTEKCIKCPNGQTTLYPGATQCIINTIPVAPPASVTVPVRFFFYGHFDCSSLRDLENFRTQVRNQTILRLKFLAVKYEGLCSNVNCQNINSVVITIGGCYPNRAQGKRRRAVADNELQLNGKIPEVQPTLTNTNASVTQTTLSVIQEDMIINSDQYNPLKNVLSLGNATAYSPIIECSNGSVYSNDVCVPCPAGTRYEVSADDTKICVTCPLNTYQSLTGQSSCTPCNGVKKYTMAVGSNSSSDCVSECVKTPNYCNTGTCTDDQFSVSCTCPAGLQGDRCQSRDQPQSSNPAIIGGTVGGGVGLLILILVIILICKKLSGKGTYDHERFRKKFNKINETDSDIPYRNPVYDNYAFQRPLPLAYNREWQAEYGHDPYNPYTSQSYTRAYEPDNEAVYYPSGTPRGHHEWRPA